MTARLTDAEKRALHEGVCPRHRDSVPGVIVCGPCEVAGDEAVERIIAAHRAAEREAVLAEVERRIVNTHTALGRGQFVRGYDMAQRDAARIVTDLRTTGNEPELLETVAATWRDAYDAARGGDES